MRRFILPVLLVFLLVSGVSAQDLRETSAAKAACGPKETTFTVETSDAPPGLAAFPGQASLYIIAAKQGTMCFRCGITIKVGMDGQWIGAVQGSSYMLASVAPGAHHLCVNWQGGGKETTQWVALRGFTAEASKSYYFTPNEILARYEGGELRKLTLDFVDEDEAKMLLEAYPQATSTVRK